MRTCRACPIVLCTQVLAKATSALSSIASNTESINHVQGCLHALQKDVKLMRTRVGVHSRRSRKLLHPSGTGARSPISTLPSEVLMLVYAFLPVGDLLCRVPVVCRDWHHRCADDAVWEPIYELWYGDLPNPDQDRWVCGLDPQGPTDWAPAKSCKAEPFKLQVLSRLSRGETCKREWKAALEHLEAITPEVHVVCCCRGCWALLLVINSGCSSSKMVPAQAPGRVMLRF